MGFLNPLVLLAALAVAVPVFLHLFHRHESRRIPFPALRYLLRTEREHARRIRLRQLVLLLLRVAILACLVAAAARLFVRGRGTAHEPTAVAVILDNSASSGRVLDDERILDRLQAVALRSVGAATSDDRIWVIRAGSPWETAVPGGPAEARRRVEETAVSAGASELARTVRRAAELVRASELDHGEIHLVSDLQATAVDSRPGTPPAGDIPLLVWAPEEGDPRPNRYLHEIRIGGGLPPLAGERSEATVLVGAAEVSPSAVSVRLVVEGRIRGATTASPGRAVVLPFGPFPEGPVEGWVETDPDALAADDRRWFTVPVRPAPTVTVRGPGSFFVEEAAAVLEAGGRIRSDGAPGEAEVLFSMSGEGLEDGHATSVVFPGADPILLPALNRRLGAAGIPWRYETRPGAGEAGVDAPALPVELDDVRVRPVYELLPAGPTPSGEVLARLESGEPWIVRGRSPEGWYVLVASPPVPEASTLPVSAAMVPLLDWASATSSEDGAGRPPREAGAPLPVSGRATAVETPAGTRHPVDGTQLFRRTDRPGIYRVLAGDTVIDRVAVNVPVRESLPDRLDPDSVRAWLGSGVELVPDEASWTRSVFTRRQGPELWRPLLLLALLLLLAESWIAASGGSRDRRSRAASRGPEETRTPAAADRSKEQRAVIG